jgi:ABC-type bacteriocin/lantibiotic exporter with double-glycine peptidase domain
MERTLSLIRTERSSLAVAVVYSVAIGLLSLVLPVTIQSLVNTVAFGSVLQPVLVLTMLVTAALIGSAILTVLRFIVLEIMQRHIFVRHASEVLDNLLRFRVEAMDQQHAPELVNRFLDVTTVQKSATILVVDGLTVLMQTLVGVALLAAYHPYLLVFDIGLIAAIVFILFALGRKAVRTSIGESRAKYDVVAWLEEVARHSVALRSVSGARLALDRTNDLVTLWLRDRERHFRILLRQVIGTQMLQAIALSSLLGIGGYLVISGELTLGQLVAAELVVSVAVSSFAKFSKSLETFYDLQAAIDKLEHLTGLPLERVSGEPVARRAGPANLKIEDLSFNYDSQRPVIRNVFLDATAGAKIAIHGRGAAGKSTLLDLIFALRDPDGGRVELDGADLRHLSLDSIRQQVMLLRDTEIFPGTVLDNVAMGAYASADEVRDALASAGVLEAVKALPNGLQTELSPSGRPLAPSQALRLTFARAMLHRPRLLLIDEALDSIEDLTADGPIVRTLFATDSPWTLIVATERPDLWPLCDRVYTMHDGVLQATPTQSVGIPAC